MHHLLTCWLLGREMPLTHPSLYWPMLLRATPDRSSLDRSAWYVGVCRDMSSVCSCCATCTRLCMLLSSCWQYVCSAAVACTCTSLQSVADKKGNMLHLGGCCDAVFPAKNSVVLLPSILICCAHPQPSQKLPGLRTPGHRERPV